MKFSHLFALLVIISPLTSYRLLGAMAPAEVAPTTMVIEREIPWEDENPDLDVMIPEQSVEEAPRRVVQEVVEVEPVPAPEPEPIIAVVAVPPEVFAQLKLENRVVDVESVGSAQ